MFGYGWLSHLTSKNYKRNINTSGETALSYIDVNREKRIPLKNYSKESGKHLKLRTKISDGEIPLLNAALPKS